MYLHGSFVTQLGETVTVHIVTGNSRAEEIEIGGDNSSVHFTADPVTIESCVNDTFDHLLRSQASIRLDTRDFMPDLFCTSCRDAVVNIYKGNQCVFAGFIEPQAYNQNYNEVYDELEISCIDALSALQYSKYKNIGASGVSYDEVKASAGQPTFDDIIKDLLNGVCSSLDLSQTSGVQYLYDGSKSLTASSDAYSIFSQLAISELLFLGDMEDDAWDQDKVLEAILKYLNLHIVQEGLSFYIFSWETVKSDTSILWRELKADAMMLTNRQTVEFDKNNVSSNDTTISIGDVYNQILLTCKVDSVENIIESPLDDSALDSPYNRKQKYITEYSSDGEGERAQKAFKAMVHGEDTEYKGAVMTDWYMQVKDHPGWTFPEGGTGTDLIDKYCKNDADQQVLPNLFPTKPCAAIIAFGKLERKADKKDNSPVSKIDMDNCLVVSVNGNGRDDETNAFPSEASLKNNAPLAVYTGNTSGGIYSPSDDDTTNYIVLSGKIVLNPIMEFSETYKALHDHTNWATWLEWAKTVPSRTNSDGRFYTQQYYKAATSVSTPVWDEATFRGLVPYTGTGPELYEFKYSAVGDSTDKISKVGVLACMLIIGDKCVVETGTQGQTSDFEWKTYKTREQCTDDDEYYQQCFTIGFDPKIDDKLIGTEFSFQNNIDYTMGLDVEGIAIPIKKADKLSGPVKFMILGPVNAEWGEVTRRHKTWFRRQKWSTTDIPLLSHVSSIFLKSFEVKIYSDNGLIESDEDNDIVYMSDTQESFINRKDDIEFEISSALTRDERIRLGVSDAVRLSTPLDATTGYGLLSIYDHVKEQQAKPEQLYVDSYYTEYHKPHILMTQKIDDRNNQANLFDIYKHPAMPGKKFYVQGLSRNLIEGYAELTIKEVWDD